MPASRRRLHHFLVGGDLVLIHHRARRPGRSVGGGRAADQVQRRLQARDADGEAGGGHLLAGEARDEIVVAPAAADGAEADGVALLVLGRDQQLGFEDGAGVVFEAADD